MLLVSGNQDAIELFPIPRNPGLRQVADILEDFVGKWKGAC
jgi:hypothetical protein